MSQSFTPVILLLFVFGFCLVSGSNAQDDTEEITIDGHLHTFPQIMKIVEASDLMYVLTPDSSCTDTTELTVLPAGLFRGAVDGQVEVQHFMITDSANLLLSTAEAAFEAEDYSSALSLYREVQLIEPDFGQILTWIGDSFFMMDDMDSAEHYFLKAIDDNFIDYDAHWFLSDVYWARGDTSRAVEHITIAHLLNVNHSTLRGVFVQRREEAGIGWDEWSLDLCWHLSRDEHRVIVTSTIDCMFYALTKAMWEHEPDYRSRMVAKLSGPIEHLLMEEREAIYSLVSTDKYGDLINRVIDDGFYQEFIVYEAISGRYPEAMLHLSEEFIKSMIGYLEEYH